MVVFGLYRYILLYVGRYETVQGAEDRSCEHVQGPWVHPLIVAKAVPMARGPQLIALGVLIPYRQITTSLTMCKPTINSMYVFFVISNVNCIIIKFFWEMPLLVPPC